MIKENKSTEKAKTKKQYIRSMIISICFILIIFILAIALGLQSEKEQSNNKNTIIVTPDDINNATTSNNYIDDNPNIYNQLVKPYIDDVNDFVFNECLVNVYGKYDGEPLNMRKGPNKNYEFITTVPDGSIVDVLGYSELESDWLYISYNDYEGWVLNKYIFSIEDYSFTDFKSFDLCRIEYTTPDNAGLNLRLSCSSDSKLLCTVPEGAIVEIVDEYKSGNNGYIEVSYGGWSGWILADYLEKIGYVINYYDDFD